MRSLTDILDDPSSVRNVRIPIDQDGAHAALRLLGAFEASTVYLINPRAELRELARRDDER